MHMAFSCRTVHLGLIWQLNHLCKIYKPIPILLLGADSKSKVNEQRELPSLVLESDIVDISSYSEVETKSKIDTFIEALGVYKSQQGQEFLK